MTIFSDSHAIQGILATLSAKAAILSKSVMLAATSCGAITFFAFEFLTERWVVAAIISALSAPACAYYASKPKIIAAEAAKAAALAAAADSNRSQLDKEYTELLKNIREDYDRRIGNLEKQLAQEILILAVTRGSRHTITNELNGLETREVLWTNKIPQAERVKKLDVGKLMKREDRQIARIRAGLAPLTVEEEEDEETA